MGLGMTHIPLKDDEERISSLPLPRSVADQLFERLSTLSSRLELAVE